MPQRASGLALDVCNLIHIESNDAVYAKSLVIAQLSHLVVVEHKLHASTYSPVGGRKSTADRCGPGFTRVPALQYPRRSLHIWP